MMIMRQWILLSLFAGIGVHAAEDRMEDYAYGLPIETRVAAPLYEIVVPIHVYQTAKRTDLGDLRVFNAAGIHADVQIASGWMLVLVEGK